jgi:hypothetical protein
MSDGEPLRTQQPEFSLVDFISSVPNFILSGLFFLTWIAPTSIEAKMVSSLTLLMLLEFINVHSSAFMENVIIGDAPREKKVRVIAGLGILYTLFVGGMSLAFETWWPLAAFWGLTLNRLLGVLMGKAPSGEEKTMMQNSWGVSIFLYVVGAGLTVFLPVPSFGITEEVVSLQGFTGDGLWEVEPQRVIVFGFLYFAGMGLYEMNSNRWIPSAAARSAGRGSGGLKFWK